MNAPISRTKPKVHRPSVEAIAEGIAIRRFMFWENAPTKGPISPEEFDRLCSYKPLFKSGVYNDDKV